MRDGYKRDFARHLRRTMTDAERRLWYHLRNRSLMHCKFRRQHPVGPYVADFACIDRRLIIELNGGQHAGGAHDHIGSSFLESEGYRVLRFWNNDALMRTDAVLSAIHEALVVPCAPHPNLPPAGSSGTRTHDP